MDLKNEILNNVSLKLKGMIDGITMDMLQSALVLELNKYDISEKITDIIPVDNTSEGLLRRYLATKRIEGKSDKTIKRYSDLLSAYISQLDRELYQVGAFDIRLYLSLYKEQRKVKNRTLDNMRKVLSSFFGWLHDEEFIPHNPCKAVKSIKYDKIIRLPFSSEEMERLKSSCTNLRDLALVHFLYATGCRVSEVVSLNIDDVDLQRRELTVYGKGGKERVVYLTPVAAMYLEKYIKSRKDKSRALFAGRGSERIQKNGIEMAMKRLGKKAGVKNVHPHRFRRTLATELIARGAALYNVQMILGHEDIRTTQVYVYVDKKDVKNTYDKYAA